MASQRETKQPGRGDRAVRRHGSCWPRDVCLAAARAVVAQGLTASAVSARFGVPYTTLLEWSRKYRAGGEARLVPASGRRQQPARAEQAPARRAAIVAAKRAQPGAGNVSEGVRPNIDVFKGPVDPARPSIRFEPEGP